jgi:hypothetical protein
MLAFVVGGGISCSGKVQSIEPRLAEIRRMYPCVDTLQIKLVVGGPSTVDACHIAGVAMRAVAEGKGRPFGIVPADTSRVKGAFVDYIYIQAEPDTTESDRMWYVELVFAGRERHLEIHVDGLSRHVGVMHPEGVLAEQRHLP